MIEPRSKRESETDFSFVFAFFQLTRSTGQNQLLEGKYDKNLYYRKIKQINKDQTREDGLYQMDEELCHLLGGRHVPLHVWPLHGCHYVTGENQHQHKHKQQTTTPTLTSLSCSSSIPHR